MAEKGGQESQESSEAAEAQDFNQQTSRRNFLKGIGRVAAGVAGAAAVVTAAVAVGEAIKNSQQIKGKVVAQIPDGDPNDPHRQNLKGNEVWNIDPNHSHKPGEPLAQIDPTDINTVITNRDGQRVDLKGKPIVVPNQPSPSPKGK